MRRAMALAERGRGVTGANPLVGAVVVRRGKVVGEGWYARFGAPHAEAVALSRAGTMSRGARLFVTIEPCASTGKTPPCTRAIVASAVREVVAGSGDPTQHGKGLRELKRAGIEVRTGLLRKEIEGQNRDFLIGVRRERPVLTLKLAISLDGRIADRSGKSKWITSARARRWSRDLRNDFDAIMVGAGTALKDDPGLDAPLPYREPLKVIVDTRASLPPGGRLFRSGRSLVAISRGANRRRVSALERRGAEVVRVPGDEARIDLRALLRSLYRLGVGSVLCEGGAELAGSLLDDELVDKAVFVISPRILGGRDAVSAVGGKGSVLRSCPWLRQVRVTRMGRETVVAGWLGAAR